MYDTKTARWLVQDPLAEKYYPFSPYNYCVNNPVMFVDLDGRDTINVVYNNQKEMWEYSTPILSEGDDVFVINGKNVIFSEGEYMNRVLLLNLEISDKFTLGLYYVSGSKDAVGFFIAPGGDASKIVGSGKRIPDGTYPITTPGGWEEWRVPGVGGDVIERGIRFHPGTNVGSTSGCFILSSGYKIQEGKPSFDFVDSKNSSKRFYEALGEVKSYNYISPKGKQRTGTKYKSALSHKVTLKSFLK
jgi:hypothetical protein